MNPVRLLPAFVAAIAVSAALAQTDPPRNTGPAGGIPGMQAPPSIPGYEPTADPRDFTGVWQNQTLPGATRFSLAPDIKLTPAAEAARDRIAAKLRDTHATSLATPHVMCRPTGINQALIPIAPVYVLQNETKMVFIVTDEIRDVRTVYLDAKHPANLKPTYGGHSVGHWEGNTLVIDTIGYNGRGQMVVNTVHSDKLHLVERITRTADGKALEIDATFEDPEVLNVPVRVKKRWSRVNGQQPLEFDCEENPREDNFAGMLFEQEYLYPVCIQHEGKGEETSRVICDRRRKP